MKACHIAVALNIATAAFYASVAGCNQTQNGAPPAPTRNLAVNPTAVRVRQLTATLLGVDRDKLSEQTSLAELGADELDFVELVMELEEEFSITIPDDAAERLLGSSDCNRSRAQCWHGRVMGF